MGSLAPVREGVHQRPLVRNVLCAAGAASGAAGAGAHTEERTSKRVLIAIKPSCCAAVSGQKLQLVVAVQYTSAVQWRSSAKNKHKK